MDTYINDVAIIGIFWVGYNNLIQSIALPTGSWASNNFVNSNVVASGFGTTSDSTGIGNNQFLTVSVIANPVCVQAYGTRTTTSGTGGRGTCGGDSGGPVVFNNGSTRILVGVVSFGGRSCQAGFPSEHATVTSFSSWIQARM